MSGKSIALQSTREPLSCDDSQHEEKLNIAILGCGYWGINYVRVFSELPQSNVVAVCDQSQARLKEVCKRFGDIDRTTDIADVVQRKDVDAIILCTPATTHYEIARMGLQQGKHMLLEKPMTATACTAKKLLDYAASQQLVLMVGHTFLYNHAVRKMKAYIDGAARRDVYYLYARRTNLGPIRYDVNAIWDLAPHDIAIFNYLLDSKPEWVSATGSKVLGNCREDIGFISLGYHDATIGHIHVSWADPNKVREVVVVSGEKRIVFDDLNSLEPIRIYAKGVKPAASDAASNYGEYHFQMRDGDITSPKIPFSEPLKNQCMHFLECISQGQRPLTDGKAGLEVVQIMEAINRSVEQNGVPVTVAYQ